MSLYHTSVLLGESVSALVTDPCGTYADATFGGGGHTAEVLSRLSPQGRVLAFDRDRDALENRMDDPRLTLIRGNFRFIRNFALVEAPEGLDGVLADLGVSSHQFDTAERGFSFRYDAPLDMRMNQEATLTAADVVNGYDAERLERILRLYGEVDNARTVARLIVERRGETDGNSRETGDRKRKGGDRECKGDGNRGGRDRKIAAGSAQGGIRTTGELCDVLAPALPRGAEHKHLARIFQALRIEVNQEMRALEKFLAGATEALKSGGRLVVITYHSLEDRMVKNFIRTGRVDGERQRDIFGNDFSPLVPVGRKPIVPSEEEIAANPRARSAKLRVAEKKAGKAEGGIPARSAKKEAEGTGKGPDGKKHRRER